MKTVMNVTIRAIFKNGKALMTEHSVGTFLISGPVTDGASVIVDLNQLSKERIKE